MTWSDFSGTGWDHSKVLVTSYRGILAVEHLSTKARAETFNSCRVCYNSQHLQKLSE